MKPPLSYLQTHGPAADPVTRLGWGLGAISVGVTVVVALLLLRAILRPRHGDARGLVVRRSGAPLRWVYVGAGLSTLLLMGSAVWTLTVLAAVARPPREPVLTVRVTGHRWWWGVRYEGARPSDTFTTANELHIPVGAPVRVLVESGDVIHSFWVPQLGGKLDAVPGLVNETWLQADQAGVYRGQCGEYCGAQHAHMAFDVVADAPSAYAAWRLHQLEPAGVVQDAGQHVFMTHCAACHAVRGTAAGGIFGPDLSHLAARHDLAAGALLNTAADLKRWLEDPQAVKPDAQMPKPQLDSAELAAVAGYLQGLN
jgi:cytochrome c oxidase subunit 2